MNTNEQNQVFTDQGSSDLPLPELLKELGPRYKFLLFKNGASELQLSHHSQNLRFRLKKKNGEILYTSCVSKLDKITRQIASFIEEGESFQQYFVFSPIQKKIHFDFEEAEQESERIEKAIRQRRKMLIFGWSLAGVIIVLLLAGFAYIKIFSHVGFAEEILRAEPAVCVVYSPERIREAFQVSPIIDLMREAQAQGLSLSNKLLLAEQKINQMVKLKASESSRLSSLTNEDLIKEFPDESKDLAAIPADKEEVIVKNVKQPHPEWNTKDLEAMGMSHSTALRTKWDLDSPAFTVVTPGVYHTKEREIARASAIQAIMFRFEDGLVKKNGTTEAALKIQANSLQELLNQNHKIKSEIQQQALDKIKNLGVLKPVNSFFQIRRKPCLLIFENHGWIFELTGEQFEVALDLSKQGEFSFIDYLLRYQSPIDSTAQTLQK